MKSKTDYGHNFNVRKSLFILNAKVSLAFTEIIETSLNKSIRCRDIRLRYYFINTENTLLQISGKHKQ